MYLAIVKREGNKLVIDKDSCHLFDQPAGKPLAFEIKIAEIIPVDIGEANSKEG